MAPTSSLIGWRAEHSEAGLPDFTCWWSSSGEGTAWVHVAGELDKSTAPQLDARLGAAQLDARTVMLDLRPLTFLDCAGLQVIADANSRARRDGSRLMVARPDARIDRLFALTGLDAELMLYDLDPVTDAPAEIRAALPLAGSLTVPGYAPVWAGGTLRAVRDRESW